MGNFNIERWQMVVGGNRHSRMICEECMKWAMQRTVFGKTLVGRPFSLTALLTEQMYLFDGVFLVTQIQQPVIRFKLGQMVAEVEAVHSLLEDLTYHLRGITIMT
jgi:alkylation response protein AidB-like acyl-CoA dehydrogenase